MEVLTLVMQSGVKTLLAGNSGTWPYWAKCCSACALQSKMMVATLKNINAVKS